MTAILYGNLRAEIVSNAGVRIQRVRLRQAAADLLAPRQPEAPRKPLMLGRDREAADAFATITAGRPAEFSAACGYGKTTLLRYVVAAAAERGLSPSCIYLRADGNRVGDLLQDLVTKLYVCDRPVKLTQQECAQLLGQVSAIVAIDDLRVSADQVDYLLEVLPGCSLVIGSAQPVLGRRGSSHQLNGLPDESALALVADILGRPLTAEELAAARRLVAAVDGQPLHLMQCATLAREGRHTLESLARQAVHDPEILDRLSINALAQHQRRALAVLAFAAGTLLPADVIDAIGQVSSLAQWLQSLHGRGLAEQCEDRFGLPVCKADGYRQLLLQDLDLAVAARGLSNWLTAADPTAADSQSAAEAALTMMEFAAERGEWASVVQLARAAERVLFLAGRWEAWHHTLGQGLDAARTSADRAAEAFFVHQQGTLAFCQDQLVDADQLLQQALTLREQIGDADGTSVTRHNLRLLTLPDPPSPPRSGVPRRVMRALGAGLGTLALVVSTVVITGVLRSGAPAKGQPTEPPSASVTQTAGSASSSSGSVPSPNGSASASTGSPSSPGQQSHFGGVLTPQVISFTSSPPPTAVVGDTYAVTVSGGGSANPVILSIAPGGTSVCSISGTTVTFGLPGRCVIDADQAGSARYQPAARAQQAVTVTGIPQSIRFTAPARGSVGQSATLSATGGRSGSPVVFSVDRSSGPGVCIVSGAHGTTVSYTAAGSCVVDAGQAGNARYQPAPQVQQAVTVTGIPQSISFTSQPPGDTYKELTYQVTAQGGGSGNPVTFSIDASSTSQACSVTGSTVTFGLPGRCVIDADQAGNARYQPAARAQQAVTVTGIPQSIRFTAPAQGSVGRSAILSATGGGSGSPVVFSVDRSSGPGVCDVSGTNGTAVSYTASGRCVIDAGQAGNAEYQAAPQAQQAVTVDGIPQSISFTSQPPGDTYKDLTYQVTAQGGGSGNPVTFSIDASSTSQACSVTGSTVTFGLPGRCVIDADQAGNAQYQAAARVQQAVTVDGIPQSIRFTSQPPASPVAGGSYVVTATGGASGNPVTFSIDASSTSQACSVTGSTVTFGQLGRCVIDAGQAGNAEYQAAPQAQQAVTVDGIPQSISFTSQPPGDTYKDLTYQVTAQGGGSGNPVTFSIDASSTSQACSVTRSTVTFGLPGRCVIDADQAGNAQYQAAPRVQQAVTVDGIPQSIRFTSQPQASPVAGGSYVVTATGGASGNPVTFSIDASSTSQACSVTGSTVTFGQLGRCVIDADQAGNAEYQAAPQAQQAVTVDGIPQSISFTSQPPGDTYKDLTYQVTAQGGGSGNPVTFSIDASSTSQACSVTGSTVTFGLPGRCVIDADQAGNAQYQAAPRVQQAVTVTGIPQSISFRAPAAGTVGGSATLSAKGGGSGSPVVFSVDRFSGPGVCDVSGINGATVSYTAAGSCVIDANQAGNAQYQAAAQVQQPVTVTGIPQSISFRAPAAGTVDGSATLSAKGGGSGSPVVFSVDRFSGPGVCDVSGTNGTTVSYTAAGSCVIDADQAGNARYQPAPQAQQTIDVIGLGPRGPQPIPRPAGLPEVPGQAS